MLMGKEEGKSSNETMTNKDSREEDEVMGVVVGSSVVVRVVVVGSSVGMGVVGGSSVVVVDESWKNTEILFDVLPFSKKNNEKIWQISTLESKKLSNHIDKGTL